MDNVSTRSTAGYGYVLLGIWVLILILQVTIPMPSGVEWKILRTSISLSTLLFGIYMVTPFDIKESNPSVKYIKYLGLVCAIVAIITLAAIPVLEVLRVLRFMD